MDTLALARKLDSLEKSWSGLDSWLDFWTALVVIGVVVEVFVIALEYSHEWKDFKRGTIHTPDKPSFSPFLLGMIGAALVAIGVAGEFRGHIAAGKIETEMRDTTRQLVSLADSKAAGAIKDAGIANGAAGAANERATKNEKDAAALRVRAAKLEADNLAERRALGFRSLTAQQRNLLKERLRPYGKTRVDVYGMFTPSTPNMMLQGADILAFSRDLVTALNDAQLDAAGFWAQSCRWPFSDFDGFIISDPKMSGPNINPVAKILLDTIQSPDLVANPNVVTGALPPGRRDCLGEGPPDMVGLNSGQRAAGADILVFVNKKPGPLIQQ